jgi:hypothetical protein
MNILVRERALRDLVDELEQVIYLLRILQTTLTAEGEVRDKPLDAIPVKANPFFDIPVNTVSRAIETLDEMRLNNKGAP